MRPVNWKSVFEQAQNGQNQIIEQMRKMSSRPLLSSHTSCRVLWFFKRRAKGLIRLCGCAGWSGLPLSAYTQRHVFAWRGPNDVWRLKRENTEETVFIFLYSLYVYNSFLSLFIGLLAIMHLFSVSYFQNQPLCPTLNNSYIFTRLYDVYHHVFP